MLVATSHGVFTSVHSLDVCMMVCPKENKNPKFSSSRLTDSFLSSEKNISYIIKNLKIPSCDFLLKQTGGLHTPRLILVVIPNTGNFTLSHRIRVRSGVN